MINKQDLRLGNWVNCHFQTRNFNAQVLEIRHGGVLVQDGEHRNTYGYDNVSPIPLTQETLEKGGFHKSKNSNEYWSHFVLASGWYISEWVALSPLAGFERTGTFYSGDNYVPFKYMHHLQNFYYDIFQKELEINL